MTYEKMLRLSLMAAVVLAFASCDKVSGDKNNDSEATDTGGGGGGDDTDTGTGQGPFEGCQDFYDYANETCGLSQIELVLVQVMCNNLDKIFIDSFMSDLVDCMTSKDCGELEAMMATAESDTDLSDAGAPGLFEECALAAAATAEPEPANEEFQEHYCDYVIQCDPEITSQTECEALFEMQELGVFMVLEEPYIGQADDCVDPMPTCGDPDVQTCLEEVGGIVGEILTAGVS